MSLDPAQSLNRAQQLCEKQLWHSLTSVADFFFFSLVLRKSKKLTSHISWQTCWDRYICSIPTRAETHCISLHLNRSCGLTGSLLGISPVLNRVHQSSQLSLVSAPPGFPPGKANGPCAAYTSPNYKDAQRVAFVPNKPPLLNYLNVPLWSSLGPAHRVPTSLWLDGSAESPFAIGRLPWASTCYGEVCAALGRARSELRCDLVVFSSLAWRSRIKLKEMNKSA